MQDHTTRPTKKRLGRPPRTEAVSHDQIMDAVYQLMKDKPLDDVSMDEIARHAGIGKPTLYKWWPNKQALLLDMFKERVIPSFPVDSTATAEEAIRRQAKELVRLLNGFFGTVTAQIIAEGQSDPKVMEAYRERYVRMRRDITIPVIEPGSERGQCR